MRLDHLLSKEQAKQETAELHPKGRSGWQGKRKRNKLTGKELSQDSKADKSQQLKKETKDQQKDAQRQRGNLLSLRRLSSVSFSGFGWQMRDYGGLAQLVERLPCKQEVSGSNPLISTKKRDWLKQLWNRRCFIESLEERNSDAPWKLNIENYDAIMRRQQ